MVRDRTIASTVGMIIGVVVVAGAGLYSGLSLFPALAISLVGLAIGGWLADQQYADKADLVPDS
jgi:hypothetical protein